jgi:hypothetical protein
MIKIVSFITIILLVGCSTTPQLRASFPQPPEVLMQPPGKLQELNSLVPPK